MDRTALDFSRWLRQSAVRFAVLHATCISALLGLPHTMRNCARGSARRAELMERTGKQVSLLLVLHLRPKSICLIHTIIQSLIIPFRLCVCVCVRVCVCFAVSGAVPHRSEYRRRDVREHRNPYVPGTCPLHLETKSSTQTPHLSPLNTNRM